MNEENKSYEENQDYHEDFDDILEIGIPIEKSMSTLQGSESPNIEPEIEPDRKTEDSEESVEKDIPDEDASADSPFDEIKDQLKHLAQAFENKLKYDDHKNKIIDDLHHSLQAYREGLVKKYLHRIITDIIKIVDDTRKFTSHYKNQPASDETSEKLFKYIENITSDLEDLFLWEGVVPFTCDGDVIDASRQRILNKIETDNPEKDKTVAERLRPGYEWDGKVIRPEMVSAYIYQTESTVEDNNI
ncbi:MAG: nucleotide exchange factor GrpE [Desulfobacteraceae bacterium]|nr:nucleotide exchange factor GrpE [Desulfobacteraceae bacterium]